MVYEIEGKRIHNKNKKNHPNTGHKMERVNSTDVRKDLLSQIHIIVY